MAGRGFLGYVHPGDQRPSCQQAGHGGRMPAGPHAVTIREGSGSSLDWKGLGVSGPPSPSSCSLRWIQDSRPCVPESAILTECWAQSSAISRARSTGGKMSWQKTSGRYSITSQPYSPSCRSEGPPGPVVGAFRDQAHRKRTRLYGEDARPSETPRTRGLVAPQ